MIANMLMMPLLNALIWITTCYKILMLEL